MPGITRRDLLTLSAAAALSLAGCGRGDDDAAASLDPNALEPFVASATAGSATGLPPRVAWASTADSQFFLALGAGMKQAAAERGLEYLTATSGNDPAKHVNHMNDFLTRGVGAMAMQPLNPDADSVALRRAIDRGVCAQGIITAPSTMQVVASQYKIGYDQGKAAADYVRAELGGNAQALYFNLDSAGPQLRLRHQGVLDGLATAGAGLDLVSDLTVAEISESSGFNTMNSALATHPDIRVVLGGDTIVVGAYRALAESGKLRDDMFISGVDGDEAALKLIAQDGAYKLSIAFAWKLMGYGLAQFGADWIEGKAVPRAVVAKGVALDSRAAIERFSDASSEPAPVFADRARYEEYLPLFGVVSHATRQTFWTSPIDPPTAAPAVP
ncbi:MAG: sugar ABC transporter substrate-binding protein [Sporichthyaceae bacterium]